MTGRTSRKSAKVAAKPKLLAGGSPQITKADGDVPVQAYVEAMSGHADADPAQAPPRDPRQLAP